MTCGARDTDHSPAMDCPGELARTSLETGWCGGHPHGRQHVHANDMCLELRGDLLGLEQDEHRLEPRAVEMRDQREHAGEGPAQDPTLRGVREYDAMWCVGRRRHGGRQHRRWMPWKSTRSVGCCFLMSQASMAPGPDLSRLFRALYHAFRADVATGAVTAAAVPAWNESASVSSTHSAEPLRRPSSSSSLRAAAPSPAPARAPGRSGSRLLGIAAEVEEQALATGRRDQLYGRRR